VKILSKYIVREHIGPLVFAMTALTSLLLLQYITKQFGKLVGKGLPWSVIGEFFLLAIPFTVAMTLPMAVLVSTLYAFSRLAAENEITALKASGVSMMKLMVPVLLGSTVLALGMLAFNDQILPRANHRLRVLQNDIARKKPTFALREQVINEVSPGKLFLRAGHLYQGSSRLREIVIYDLSDPSGRRTIYADSGMMAFDADGRDLILTLHHGHIQQVSKQDPSQLQRLFYDVDRIRVAGVGNQLERSENDNYKSDREMSICEMQRDYQDAETEGVAAQKDLEQALANSAKLAATGQKPPPPRQNRGDPSLGLGRFYCGGLALVGVAVAAQTPLPPSAGGGSVARPGTGAAGRDPRDRPTMYGPERPASVLAQAAASSKARIDEARRTTDLYGVEIQKKFALSAACIVFVLLGAPVAIRFPRGGVGLVISVSLAAFALYYIGLIAGEAVADRGYLSPFWAMWAANMLFTAIGVLFLARMGKESETARGGDFGEFLTTVRVWIAKAGRKVGIPLDRRRYA
jgi:lipopolysaccharide export system permease protein